MAKAKWTQNGNVKVTMSQEQWTAINAILVNVRLGFGGMKEEISYFLEDTEWFNHESGLDDAIINNSDRVWGSVDKEDGFVIELKD